MSFKWQFRGKDVTGPSWREMVNEACTIMNYPEPDLLRMRGSDLQILEYFGLTMGSFSPLTNWLVRRMDPSDRELSQSHLHQVLADLDRCNLFYTTNYDDFIERALKLKGRTVQAITSEREMVSGPKVSQVVKYHGDFNRPEEMVFSERHYYRRMRFECPLDWKLRSDLLNRVLLFVGYSFNDMNVALLFELINATLNTLPDSTSGKRAYIISHNPSDFECKLFERRNVTVIPTYGNDRTAATANVLMEMCS
ncbi:SIR2 family protein [Pararhodospirillum oryzae]|nr:SIR2 family protein [Pararhodospirillum oryzae]